MNCKFHPTAEAVTKCAECGKPICFYCDQKAFFRTEDEDKKPLCLECSLKKAKIEFAKKNKSGAEKITIEDLKNAVLDKAEQLNWPPSEIEAFKNTLA